MTNSRLQLVKDSVNKVNKTNSTDWLDIKDEHMFEHSPESLRKYATGWNLLVDWGLLDLDNTLSTSPTENTYKYKETTEILGDGSHRSDKVVEMSPEQSKDSTFLLKSHGFDVNEWEITSAKNSIWNANSKVDGIRTLYSSKITVKPKVSGFNIDKFIGIAQKKITPINVTRPSDSSERLLELPFVDMHFGINSFESYQQTLVETLELIKSKKWAKIYIPIGNDLLHNNDFKGRTANGTIIDKVDIPTAWNHAFDFYSHIYEEALLNAVEVESHYVAGNHDTEMTWALTKALEVKFPQVKWDTTLSTKKFLSWKEVVVVSLHGDKGLQRVVDTLITKYRNLITNAKCVEIHSGHLHSEKVKDKYGILIRTLPTSAIEDNWHEDMSFEGSVKTFQVFEYTSDKLKTIHYI